MRAVNLQTANGHHKTAAMFVLLTLIFSIASAASTHQPNIVVIVADDLGFNDVSFRGSNDILTPNIDALAYTGRILDRHYVLPTCTPSRSALLTAKYPARTGMQGFPLRAGEARAVPTELTLLPGYLKRLNYSTHLIGKWHQGGYRWAQTPQYRGFDSFLGYYHGYIGYYDHAIALILGGYTTKSLMEAPAYGVDMHRNDTVARDVQGIYATELFTREAEKLIKNHDKKTPLFVDLSHLAVHTGKDGVKVEVEDEAENEKKFGFIKDPQRRRYAGALTSLDKSVGRVVKALADADMLQNTIILFIADNGGETIGMHSNAASNYPLRGQKFTQFEGGVRGAAVLWYAGLKPTQTLYSDYVHITDWLPTFYEAAGGDVSDLDDIDGVSQWGRITGRETKAPRTEFLVNSEHKVDNETLSCRSYVDGPWKLVLGVVYPKLSNYSGDTGISEGAEPYDFKDVVSSETTSYLLSASQIGREDLMIRAGRLRKLATLPNCREGAPNQVPTCNDGCLFNVIDDPCETRDVSAERPDVVAALKEKLKVWQLKTVPQLNRGVDPASDPRNYDGTWVPWGDVPPYEAHCRPQGHDCKLNRTPDYSSYFFELYSLFAKMWSEDAH